MAGSNNVVVKHDYHFVLVKGRDASGVTELSNRDEGRLHSGEQVSLTCLFG